MNKNEQDFIWNYLKHATLQDVISEAKANLSVWFIASSISVFIAYIFNSGSDAFDISASNFIDSIPDWIFIAVALSGFFWVYRGEELKFTMPNFGFKSWLFISVLMTLMLAVLANFPYFVSIPFFWFYIIVISFLDGLGEKGKNNLESISDNAEDNF